jgi:DNA-binding GntR family transcriptional regulator
MAEGAQTDRWTSSPRLDPPHGGPRRSAYEYVVDALRQSILDGTLAGGTRLVQNEIAQQLAVSTTPVREALRELASEGLVRLDAHRGGIVNELSYEDLLEVHELCRLVEPEAMREVVSSAGTSMLRGARKLAEQMRSETDPARWAELNRQFHGQLVDAIPSQRFRILLKGLRGSVALYVAMALRSQGREHFDAANDEHLQILEAIDARDADRCAELTRAHVDLTLRALDEAGHSFAGYRPAAGPPITEEGMS